MAKLGDVTGDKIDDFIICTPLAGDNLGSCTLVFGKKSSWPAQLNITEMSDQTNTFEGEFAHGMLGFRAAGGADLDGDGINDFVVGAPGDGYNKIPGRVYIVRGGSHLTKEPIHLSKPDGKRVIRVQGEGMYAYFGRSLAFEGNVGGGPGPDVIIGAPGATVPGIGIGVGTVSILYDNPLPFDPIINASSLHGSKGFTVIGQRPQDSAGIDVQFFANVTGDAIGSIGISGPYGQTAEGIAKGKVYLVRGVSGERQSPFYLNQTNGENGSIIEGLSSWSQCGISIGTANFTGSGLDDIVIGCPLADGLNHIPSGVSIVVFGHLGKWEKIIDPNQLNGTKGLLVEGAQQYDQAGSAVSGVGDLHKLAIGAPGALENGEGATYILFNADTPPLPVGSPDRTVQIVFGSLALASIIGSGVAAIIIVRRKIKSSREQELEPMLK